MELSNEDPPISRQEQSIEKDFVSQRTNEKRFMEELMSNLPPSFSHEEGEDDEDDNEEDDHVDDDWIAISQQRPNRLSTKPISPLRPMYPQKHIFPQRLDTKNILPPRSETKHISPQRHVHETKHIHPKRPVQDTKHIHPQRPVQDTKHKTSPMKPGLDWSSEEKPVSRRDQMKRDQMKRDQMKRDQKEVPHQNDGKLIIENLLQNLPSDSSPKPCPKGWHTHGPKCYIYVPFKTTWPDAERNCLILGGNLASVHGPNQYRFLLSIIEKSGKKDQRTWVGANDAIQEDLWLWSDGSRFKYHNWSAGQPSNYKGQEHCMEMNYGADRGQNDAPCWSLKKKLQPEEIRRLPLPWGP
ncbi:hypothetical protein DPEC_G00106220 [Dallia pectoralis]|uniref:Uncharacterized protein n=1 Tax=Dallia pectoralis TaxID=75939 RepID=A0ACC2GY29_DALPE|nr:hypothetical protein DPEC_G00106220 [Dallia pectoralis]